jgi:hypothetical protein
MAKQYGSRNEQGEPSLRKAWGCFVSHGFVGPSLEAESKAHGTANKEVREEAQKYREKELKEKQGELEKRSAELLKSIGL